MFEECLVKALSSLCEGQVEVEAVPLPPFGVILDCRIFLGKLLRSEPQGTFNIRSPSILHYVALRFISSWSLSLLHPSESY